MTIVQIDAETRIRQHFFNQTIHFKQFFFCHCFFPYKAVAEAITRKLHPVQR